MKFNDLINRYLYYTKNGWNNKLKKLTEKYKCTIDKNLLIFNDNIYNQLFSL